MPFFSMQHRHWRAATMVAVRCWRSAPPLPAFRWGSVDTPGLHVCCLLANILFLLYLCISPPPVELIMLFGLHASLLALQRPPQPQPAATTTGRLPQHRLAKTSAVQGRLDAVRLAAYSQHNRAGGCLWASYTKLCRLPFSRAPQAKTTAPNCTMLVGEHML